MNTTVLNFIKLCLRSNESDRPSAADLLNEDFFVDIDSEENNCPVRLNTKDFEETIKRRDQRLLNDKDRDNKLSSSLRFVEGKEKNLFRSEKTLNKFKEITKSPILSSTSKPNMNNNYINDYINNINNNSNNNNNIVLREFKDVLNSEVQYTETNFEMKRPSIRNNTEFQRKSDIQQHLNVINYV